MRIAVITSVPEVAVGYGEICRGYGHDVPVTIVPSMFRERFDESSTVFIDSVGELAPLLREHEVDLGLCTGFPWLVPQDAIDAPRFGIVNGHPTMLPKGRGPFPWAWAVRNADAEIGLTYHYMDASFDTGNVLAQTAVPFGDDEDEATLIPKMQAAVAELLPEVLAKVEAGDPGVPQGEGGEYQRPFEPEYAELDTTRSAADAHRQVRAWSFIPERHRAGPLHGGRRVTASSLTELEGAERIECADGPLWVSYS